VGLFSGIGKLVGKVGKFALSQATHGVSDKVLGILKSRGQKPRDLEKMSPAKREALIAKVMQPTAVFGDDRMVGGDMGRPVLAAPKIPIRARAITIAKQALAGDGMVGQYGTAKKKRRRSLYVKAGSAEDQRLLKQARQWMKEDAVRDRAAARAAPAAPRRRRPPTGGLDLKALSASWKKAGKPGTWQAWISANK